MNSATWVALVAVAVAVTIPWLTFRLAMRQDHVRWIREQRTELWMEFRIGEMESDDSTHG